MKKDDSLMKFPADFHIKIIGTNNDTFVLEMLAIARKHFPDTDDNSIRSQVSEKGSYLALTVTLYVHDQVSLDALYAELTSHPDTKWVL